MAEINIRTAQNVVIEYSLSSLWERIVATLLDYIIVVVGYLIFLWLMSWLRINIELPLFGGATYGIVYMLFVDAYNFGMEVLNNGQTVGKVAMNLRVIKLNGDNPNVFDYIMRGVMRWIDVYFTLGSFAALAVASSKRNQRLGDFLGDTTVVRGKRFSRVSLTKLKQINSFTQHDISYPQVKLLTEEEMLLVKETLRRRQVYPNKAHVESLNLLVEKVCEVLAIEYPKTKPEAFLQTILKDYVYLTR